jgi:hypothetical protein
MLARAQDTAPAALAARIPALGATARLAIDVAPPVALFVLLERWLLPACRLPQAAYFEPVIALPLVRSLAHHPLPLLALAALVALRGPLLRRGWQALEHGAALRLFVGGLALVFAVTFASYEPNLYFDRLHAADRVLLLLFAGLACWRPGFLLLFLPLLFAVVWQFEYPLGGYSWTDKLAPVQVLLFFVAAFLWLAVTGARRSGAFLFGAGCLVAAHYWIAGLEKLRLGWLAHGQLHHLTLAAWQNGWLVSLDAAGIAALARALARVEPLVLGFTIAAEAGALLFFWRREAALALLAAWVLLHGGIFAVSGICFWKWALLDAGLLALLFALRRAGSVPLFGPGPLLLSLLLIAGAPLWCKPVRLGWFDTRLAYTYRYTVLGAGGGAFRIAASFFAPYDLRFSQNRFDFLTPRPALVSTYGMTQDAGVAGALASVRSLAEVEALEAHLGVVHREPKQAERFDDFMRRFFAARNRRLPLRRLPRPPLHIWTAPREPVYADQEPVAGLVVERVTTLWDGERLHELRVERVRELAFAAPASLAAAGDVARGAGVGADHAVEPVEQRREREREAQRREPEEVVDDVAAARETQQRNQRRLEVAVAARDLAAFEAAQQMAQPVLGEAEVVVGRLVDLEQERRAQDEHAARRQHAVQLGDREIGRRDVLEHFEQEDGVEAAVLEAAQVADVCHEVRAARRIEIDLHHAAAPQRRDASREQAAGADVEHARAAGQRLERGDLALEERVQVLAAEAIRGVLHARAVAQQTHATRETPAQPTAHPGTPRPAGMLAPGGA